MSNIDKKAQQEMQKELEKCTKGTASLKSYFELMKELTLWLQEKKKK